MRLWIDAAGAATASPTVFGMSPIERHVRAGLRAGVAAEDIEVDFGEAQGDRSDAQALASVLPGDLAASGVRAARRPGDVAARLRAALQAGASPLFAVAGDVAVDPRLLARAARLAETLVLSEERPTPRALPQLWSTLFGRWPALAEPSPSALLLAPGAPLPPAATLGEVAQALLSAGVARRLKPEEFDAHIAMQRRDVPPWLRFLRTDAERAQTERFLFDASYKGSTDVFTRYVYPFLVWPLTRWATAWRVHPNTITLVSWAFTFAVVPFCALGWWWAGLACAWTMSVLDSVDGKVARLTFTDSKIGVALDHGLDYVHPPLWYAAWALGLAALPPLAAWQTGALQRDPMFLAALILVGFYLADRLTLAVYKAVHKRGLHAHAPLDARVRLFISRRNVNLPLFTLALPLGLGREAFWLMAVWQAATWAWHAGRSAWVLLRREVPRGVDG
jgi:phosphatidylglycerophosphate synthase